MFRKIKSVLWKNMSVQILHRFQDPEAERLVMSESGREHVSQLTGTEACDK